MKHSPSHYIVIDLMSGALDGFYFNKKVADEMIPFFNERHPNGMWIVVEVVTPTPNMRIPEHMFHVDKLGFGKHAKKVA